MKLLRIHIEIDLTPEDLELGLKEHATEWDYDRGMWTFNGPIKSHITTATHAVYQILTEAIQRG